MRAVSSFKKNVLTIQRLPEVSDIPLGPYSLGKVGDRHGLSGTGWSGSSNRIMDEIKRFQGWESLEKAFYGGDGLCPANKMVVYSLSVYYIDVATKEIILGSGVKLQELVPKVTLSINSGAESGKRVQHSREVFLQQGHRLRWGSCDQASLEQKKFKRISFSVPIYQVEDDNNYFSLALEGVSFKDSGAGSSVPKRSSVILGTAFSPLPSKNDKWSISIPIYSCFQAETFLDSKDSQLVSNISPNTFKRLGKIGFTLSRREDGDEIGDQEAPLQKPAESSSSAENEITREIRKQVLSCLEEITRVGEDSRTVQSAVRKSVVSGEVAQSILSSGFKEETFSIREKELELKEREIQIREKELELQIKKITEQGMRQEGGESGAAFHSSRTQMEREKGGSLGRDHSYNERKFNYFRVKDKSSKMCSRIQLAKQRSYGVLSLAPRGRHEEDSRRPCRHRKDRATEKGRKREGRRMEERKEEKKEEKKEEIKADFSESWDLREQSVYHPVQIPLLVNNLPVSSSPAVYTGALPQSYVLYCPPTSSSVNKENSSVQTQTQFQLPEVCVESLKPRDSHVGYQQMRQVQDDRASTRRDWRPISLGALGSRAHGESVLCVSSLTRHSGVPPPQGGGVAESSDCGTGMGKNEEREIDEFLKTQSDQISIDCGTILSESGVCSNSRCKYRTHGRMEYSKCEFTNTEMNNWRICQYCQMEVFPSLYFFETKRPRFVEFFFDSSVPICFPSRQLVWPTSLHFLLAQFSSSCSEVRECKTHNQLLSLARKRRTWMATDILPNIAVIILAMKVFQHAALQQLLLTFSEREFFLLKEYWMRHDPFIRLTNSDSAPALSNIGESLITTLEQLRFQIQKYQKRTF